MNDTAVTTARARFPRGLHQPQDSYRFGADALLLAAFAAELDKLPSWAEVCKARAEAERQEKASRGR